MRRPRIPAVTMAMACLAVWLALAAHAVAGPSFLVSDNIKFGSADPSRDRVTDLVLDVAGNAYVAGVVGSYNFPGISSAVVTNAGWGLRYVTRIDLAARKPLWVAAVGSASRQSIAGEARGLAIDGSGAAYVVAYDGSRNFPLTGGAYEAAGDRYVFRISSAGTVSRYSPMLDRAIRSVGAIAVDASGNIYLTGSADSGLATSPGAAFPASAVAPGCVAPFVLKLDPTGQSTLYATYLGLAGTQGERCGAGSPLGVFDPTGFAVAIDAAGNAIVGGQAEPGVRATAGALDTASKQPTLYVPNVKAYASHAFVSKVNATGSAIVFTARLGGTVRERVTSLALDPTGNIYLGGKTASSDFPTTPYFGSAFPFSYVSCPGMPNAPEMGFVAKLTSDGAQMPYAGFLPMSGDQLANCQGNPGADFAPVRVALDPANRLFAVGPTNSLRAYTAPANSIATLDGSSLLFIVAADGRSIEYSTLLAAPLPNGAAFDAWGHFWSANGNGVLQRISAGTTPVEFTNPVPLCATGSAVGVRVAGANNSGTVEFFVDGQSAGSAPVALGVASKTIAMAPGARRLVATYHGASYFDGYSSDARYMPVDQAGACQ